MESSLEWLSEEDGILKLFRQGKEQAQFQVFVLGEEEAELKLICSEIVETTKKTEKVQEKIISEMTECVLESFLQLWNMGHEETSLVEQKGTRFAQILDSIPVVKKRYSEYMMQCAFVQQESFLYNSDKLKLIENEDSILCENEEGTFFCRLIPYTSQQEGERSFYLYEVEVDRKKRNRGIATNCLTELFNSLAAESAVTIYLQVGSYNEPAVHLYEKLGFQVSEELCYYTPEETE